MGGLSGWLPWHSLPRSGHAHLALQQLQGLRIVIPATAIQVVSNHNQPSLFNGQRPEQRHSLQTPV